MEEKGVISRWDEERGYGFIRTGRAERDLFVHAKALPAGSPKPVLGDLVWFTRGTAADGRLRAARARIDGAPLASPPDDPQRRALRFAVGVPAAVLALTLAGFLPAVVPLAYLLLGPASVLAYGSDKRAAVDGTPDRLPENFLHLLALFGGWPGALWAQEHYRHKTRKKSFRAVFWATVVGNLAALAYLISPYGEWAVRILGGRW